MQACLLMEESGLFEFAFCGTSPFTEVYTGLRGIEKIDTTACVEHSVGHGFTWRERGTRGGVGSISRECILCKKCTILHSLVEKDLGDELKTENLYSDTNAHWLNMHILIHTYVMLVKLHSVSFSFDGKELSHLRRGDTFIGRILTVFLKTLKELPLDVQHYTKPLFFCMCVCITCIWVRGRWEVIERDRAQF